MSVHYHEVLLDEAGTEVGIDDPMPAEPDPAEMARFGGISARLQGYWVEPGANGGPRDARTPGEPADPTIEYGSGKGPV